MSPKISVIVPVYMAEKYLDKCAESISRQSCRNIEVILVDDGSPDNCPALCDAWAKRDGRFRAVHQKMQAFRQPETRECALQRAII